MLNYMIVYSFSGKGSAGTGRCFVETSLPINTQSRVEEIEASTLKMVQERDPYGGMDKVCIINWKELRPTS